MHQSQKLPAVPDAESEITILCEGDGDCFFYRRIYHAIRDPSPRLPLATFVSSGGKYALPGLIAQQQRQGASVHVITDFDLLLTEAPLAAIVEALKGEWPKLRPAWQVVDHAIRVHGSIAATAFPAPLNARGSLHGKTRHQVKPVRAQHQPWIQAKHLGVSLIPEEHLPPYRQLSASLERCGLFLVEVGELERFVPHLDHHGTRWAAQVFKRYNPAVAVELAEARRFVRRVLGERGSVATGGES